MRLPAPTPVRRARHLRLRTAAFVVACLGAVGTPARASTRWLHTAVMPELAAAEAKRTALTRELQALRIGPDARHLQLGYQLYPVADAPLSPPWLQLDLGTEHAVDAIALVPAPQPAIAAGSGGYGFPRRFRIDAAADAAFTASELLADFTRVDVLHEGIEPFVVRLSGRRVRFVRLTVTGLAEKGRHWFFALGELIVLSGNRNVALASSVTASDPQGLPPAWAVENVVDGRTPLGPLVRLNAEPQLSRQNGITAATPALEFGLPTMMLDLGSVRDWQEVRLFGMHSSVFGTPSLRFPVRLRVEASADPAFAAPQVLLDSEAQPLLEPADPLTIPAASVRGRYLRITGQAADDGRPPRFSLSEIQVYADGRNVAAGAMATARPRATPEVRDATDLTDGRTSLGEVIELPTWLELWQRRSQLRAELDELAARQAVLGAEAEQRLFTVGAILAAVVLLGVPGFAVFGRVRRRRTLAAFRSRLARDLHDEIGSNLAAVAMLSEVAAKSPNLPAAACEDWREVRRIAQETTGAMREMLWLMGAREESGLPFAQQLEFTAQRLLRGHDIVWRQQLAEVPSGWTADARREFLLTYKEALANVVRHANATRVELATELQEGEFVAEICDNGRGFPRTLKPSGVGLRSIAERMAAMGGTVRTENLPAGGARVVLRVAIAPATA